MKTLLLIITITVCGLTYAQTDTTQSSSITPLISLADTSEAVSTSKWNSSLTLQVGHTTFNEDLGKSISNQVFFGVFFGGQRNRFTLFGHFTLGAGIARSTITYQSSYWENKDPISSFIMGAGISYKILKIGSFRLTPYATVGGISIGEGWGSDSRDDGLTVKGINSSLGVFADFGNSSDLGLFRIRYSYSTPRFRDHIPQLIGSFHSISIGHVFID